MEAVHTRALFWTAFQVSFSPVSRLFNAVRRLGQSSPRVEERRFHCSSREAEHLYRLVRASRCAANGRTRPQKGYAMSVVDSASGRGGSQGCEPRASRRPLHRLAFIRRLKGISRRMVARHMNVDVDVVRREEVETADLPLSRLHQWQDALKTPISELLVESEDSLSHSLSKRAQFVRLMKGALAIREQTEQEAVHLMAKR